MNLFCNKRIMSSLSDNQEPKPKLGSGAIVDLGSETVQTHLVRVLRNICNFAGRNVAKCSRWVVPFTQSYESTGTKRRRCSVHNQDTVHMMYLTNITKTKKYAMTYRITPSFHNPTHNPPSRGPCGDWSLYTNATDIHRIVGTCTLYLYCLLHKSRNVA